jgi:hypothetical protein
LHRADQQPPRSAVVAAQRASKGPDFPTGEAQLHATKRLEDTVYTSTRARAQTPAASSALENAEQRRARRRLENHHPRRFPYGWAQIHRQGRSPGGRSPEAPSIVERCATSRRARCACPLRTKRGTDQPEVMAYLFKEHARHPRPTCRSTSPASCRCRRRSAPGHTPSARRGADARSPPRASSDSSGDPPVISRFSLQGRHPPHHVRSRGLKKEDPHPQGLGRSSAPTENEGDQGEIIPQERGEGRADASTKLMARFKSSAKGGRRHPRAALYRLAKLKVAIVPGETQRKRQAKEPAPRLAAERRSTSRDLVKSEPRRIKARNYADKRARVARHKIRRSPVRGAEDFIVAEGTPTSSSSQGLGEAVREGGRTSTGIRPAAASSYAVAQLGRSNGWPLLLLGGCCTVPSRIPALDRLRRSGAKLFHQARRRQRIATLLAFRPRRSPATSPQ